MPGRLGGQVHQDISAMSARPAVGQDAGGELRTGHRVDCGDQQPFSRCRRVLPGQVQHVHIVVVPGAIGETSA
jgi:hypothetical protein